MVGAWGRVQSWLSSAAPRYHKFHLCAAWKSQITTHSTLINTRLPHGLTHLYAPATETDTYVHMYIWPANLVSRHGPNILQRPPICSC